MKYSLFIILIIVITSCNKEPTLLPEIIPPDNCQYSQEIEDLYSNDAKHLLMSEIYEDTLHVDYNNPYFDTVKIATILNGFQSIYDLSIPERDTIIDYANIHVRPLVSLQSVSLKVDTGAQEVRNLIDGVPTGNAILDSIVQEFGFDEVKTAYSYPDFNWLSIKTEGSFNQIPIVEVLGQLPFFYYAGLGGFVGDGNNIALTTQVDHVLFDFSIGLGDCPAGCIYRRHWIFSVNSNCEAEFLYSYD